MRDVYRAMEGDPDELGKSDVCVRLISSGASPSPAGRYDPPPGRIGDDRRIMYIADDSGSMRDVLVTCKICAKGSMTPLFFGGRPGDRPQYKDIKAQCDKCGSILSAISPASRPDDVTVRSNDFGSW